MLIDVVAHVEPDDRSDDARVIRHAYADLEEEIQAETVRDMVDNIIVRLGAGNQIERLRIFAHGRPGMLTLKRLSSHSRHHGVTANTTDANSVITERGGTVTNDWILAELNGKFQPGGYVELHSCNVAAMQDGVCGASLLLALAKILGVHVKGSTQTQYLGGGMEGPVLTANPDGRTFVRRARRL
jgi:hypothetical protein